MEQDNTNLEENSIPIFVKFITLKSIKEKTCFKNPENVAYMNVILTHRPKKFQISTVVETGLSDVDKMCVTVIKMYYCKQRAHVITNGKFKIFSNHAFMKDLE